MATPGRVAAQMWRGAALFAGKFVAAVAGAVAARRRGAVGRAVVAVETVEAGAAVASEAVVAGAGVSAFACLARRLQHCFLRLHRHQCPLLPLSV
jgi:hypothetical protein